MFATLSIAICCALLDLRRQRMQPTAFEISGAPLPDFDQERFVQQPPNWRLLQMGDDQREQDDAGQLHNDFHPSGRIQLPPHLDGAERRGESLRVKENGGSEEAGPLRLKPRLPPPLRSGYISESTRSRYAGEHGPELRLMRRHMNLSVRAQDFTAALPRCQNRP